MAAWSEKGGTAVVAECGKRWWLIHTKAKNENALARDLDSRKIENFLPLAPVERMHSGRRQRVHVPLFPGYLFMNGGEDERYTALATNRAANVIRVADQELLAKELGNIRRIVNSGRAIDVAPAVRVGSRCSVKRGPLKGLEGIVIRKRGACRVHIWVHVLAHGAELEIDSSLLEVLETTTQLNDEPAAPAAQSGGTCQCSQ